MNRRRFLELAPLSLLLGGCPLTFEQGLMNECRDPAANALLADPRVQAAWQGLRADRVWDVHVHLFGNGRGGQLQEAAAVHRAVNGDRE